jgi:demethylmenaquinone methyltransferase/2-methoxy-6-polyprenyl-1,4-benzoquinol methylase
MLEVGRQKIARAKLPITLQEGDAQTLPFEDASFDAVTIAFGIRNVPARLRALREMYRVTKPGGRVAVLELSEPRPGLFGALAKWHVHVLVPFVGGLLSGKREYGYLQASIAAFPPAEVFASTMEEAGLEVLSVTPLTMGVAHLFVAQRARL